jgi:hypothetical protein
MYPAPNATDCQVASFRHREMLATGQREQFVASLRSPTIACPSGHKSLRHRLAGRLAAAGGQLRDIHASVRRAISSPGVDERGATA